MKSADTEGSGRLIRIRISDCARMEKGTDRNLTGKTAASLPATHFSNSKVQGATIGNTAVAFVCQSSRISSTFDLTTQGNSSDRFNYYISGVAAGRWRAESWNGSHLASYTVSEESGLLVFNAPAGYVRLVYLGNN